MRKRKLLLGLLGYPLGHSLSAHLHEHLMVANGLDGSYNAFEVKEEDLANRLNELKAQGTTGLNVTIPHKQRIIPLLDQVGENAASVQAVNTVTVQEGRLIGYNTDIEGFRLAMQRHDFNPAEKVAIVLGAGGAARAVVWTLIKARLSPIHIFNRTPRGAEKLAEELVSSTGFHQFDVGPLVDSQIAPLLNKVDLVVNTTSLGMWPNVERVPFRFAVKVPHLTVMDLVYNPVRTAFLRSAHAAGAAIIDGLDMFIYQGVESLKIWLGDGDSISLDFENTREVLMKELQNR